MNLIGVQCYARHALLRAVATLAIKDKTVVSRRLIRLSSTANVQLQDKEILDLLQRVADGKVSPQKAAKLCDLSTEYEVVGDFAKIDTTRKVRTGFPEVVYAEGKTPAQVAAIMSVMIERGEDNVMASRVTSQAADAICSLMSRQHLTYYEVPRILASKKLDKATTIIDDKKIVSMACVLCAGTSDLPVAEEAAISLELADHRVTRLYDVGVAGIHRLLRNQHILQAADVAICVAGMDGALPGVVGGLTSAPVIAVPTSVGYGAAFGGLAPLLTMLNACSPGVGVVNIDNGFGAAVLAARILQNLTKS
ncbi:1-(5-phosphoribosyl)-5-amino-4-imidazole-carboxylate carboxylase [Plasmopara halstedii]|uniref:phosphoribosylaminoimidazole carboxylase n=1 Tax=Plasmopara halstedii TaxID=4781 RepID=A0A0P1ABX6_PLAHL|nr:1-(5-phosphoribosyl)-5-amino-4-imidazole-carboxylate carboxylase [Plasmopara halstedii]CEG37913.1 1-(5-phosphoribosyl)-5-amino-4-imidazole-carboxylate carboxylase [Plasmopara halstedii]|eukprot:XP_024574282.1 1-(5-phosphoribosyl)-5-amino-4-imidazole-carboxylate carboxylase [Plasmopara halstedii]